MNDNSIQCNHKDDKLFKVRPLVDQLLESFKKHQEIYVWMIGTKSRISFHQYIRNKPKKWGVKVFILADSETGYILNFEVYTGKRDIPDGHLPHSDEVT